MRLALLDRGTPPLQPRCPQWSDPVTLTTTNSTQIVAGIEGTLLILAGLIASNASPDNTLLTIRWGSDGTDYVPLFLPSDGGIVIANLVQMEMSKGAEGEGLFAKLSVGVTSVYVQLAYFVVTL